MLHPKNATQSCTVTTMEAKGRYLNKETNTLLWMCLINRLLKSKMTKQSIGRDLFSPLQSPSSKDSQSFFTMKNRKKGKSASILRKCSCYVKGYSLWILLQTKMVYISSLK